MSAEPLPSVPADVAALAFVQWMQLNPLDGVSVYLTVPYAGWSRHLSPDEWKAVLRWMEGTVKADPHGEIVRRLQHIEDMLSETKGGAAG